MVKVIVYSGSCLHGVHTLLKDKCETAGGLKEFSVRNG